MKCCGIASMQARTGGLNHLGSTKAAAYLSIVPVPTNMHPHFHFGAKGHENRALEVISMREGFGWV